ncbi:hypothetical protein MMC21_001893 [Puttea exsequens]|nr:hypothetical protein [Puttea exsequens]
MDHSDEGSGAVENLYPPDYVQPVQSESLNPQLDYYPPLDAATTLELRQLSSTEQILSNTPEAGSEKYIAHIRSNPSFLNKADVKIEKEANGLQFKVGEGRFERYGTGTSITYQHKKGTLDIRLEDHRNQRYIASAFGQPLYWWQVSKANQYVIEIAITNNELVARFTYSGEHAYKGRDVKDGTVLGILEVAEAGVLDELVSMTVVLIERAKRRGKILKGADGTAPVTSLAAERGTP